MGYVYTIIEEKVGQIKRFVPTKNSPQGIPTQSTLNIQHMFHCYTNLVASQKEIIPTQVAVGVLVLEESYYFVALSDSWQFHISFYVSQLLGFWN